MKIGKTVAGKLYVHKSALSLVDAVLQGIVEVASWSLPEGFEFDVIRGVYWNEFGVAKASYWNDRPMWHSDVSFISAPGFDTENEPIIVSSVKVKDGVATKIRFESKTNPPIYHGKHLFVAPDYKGFDVEAARKRCADWNKYIEKGDKNKIGRLLYWQEFLKKHNIGG